MYHQKYYKLISIDLSKQTNTVITQQINFTEKLVYYVFNIVAMFFITEKLQKAILNVSLDSLIVTE